MTQPETATDLPTSSGPSGVDYVSDREFADFPVREETLRGILDLGFKVATPVQAQTVDPALAGKDLLVRAKTGTGKTAAFCVPIVERAPDGFRKPFAIVLEPTRELAMQTAEQMETIATYRDLGVLTLVGGVAMGPQEKALADGVEIIVGTPGRVLDHMRRGNLDVSNVSMVCLDEADEMLSMGFFEDVTRILQATPEGRQILLYSATISDETQRLVSRWQKDPVEIYLSTDTEGASLIEHVIYETSHELHKARALLYLLDIEDPSSAIIFCNTREDAATVANFLDRQGLDAQLISGELTQARRNAVMARVKAGEVRFLVATDVASRGIDISDLSHVVNYSLPQDPSTYLHRTGRTGRIGKRGTAISLVGGPDLNTRRALEGPHGIVFQIRHLPGPEDAVRMRVERQAKQIRDAMGSLVFESYLPTVRALLEREDGPLLLAASLRAFFQWDRERKAKAAGTTSVSEALAEARAESSSGEGRRGDDRRSGGRDDKRGPRARDGRSDRPERTERSSRPERSERTERPPRTERPARVLPDVDNLDDLLSFEDDGGSPKPPADSPTGEATPKKKRTRSKGRSTEAVDAPAGEPQAPPVHDDLGDLDALLGID